MFNRTISAFVTLVVLGTAASGAVLAQNTTITDGAGSEIVVNGDGRTVIHNGAGNTVVTRNRSPRHYSGSRRHGTTYRSHTSIIARGADSNVHISRRRVKTHQSDGQYGTITRGGITGRNRNGETGTISISGY